MEKMTSAHVAYSFLALFVTAVLAIDADHAVAGETGKWCPETIETQQEPKTIPEGYAVSADTLGPSRLTYVSFFDGPPEQQADLVPDEDKGGQPEWHFSSPSKVGGYWIGCHYSRTQLMLTRQLPASVRKCSVSYQKRDQGLIEGERPIKQITCG
jgi:hypothetical protein